MSVEGVSELLFRVAGDADVDALLRLYGQLASGTGGLTREKLTQVFGELASRSDAAVWLAERDGAVVGTFILFILPALGDRCRPLAVVEDVVVDETLRGGGIGRRMMEFALRKAREANCYKLMLSSNLKRAEAHAFYESLGFQRHGYSFLVDL